MGQGPVSPGASPSTSGVASTGGGSSPSPSSALNVLGKCRLPVNAGNPAKLGWLDVPGGTFTPDPASVGHISPDSFIAAWDPAIASWVPTDPKSISPDGTRYVATNTSLKIDIIDAKSGSTIAAIPPHYQSGPPRPPGLDYQGVFVVLGFTPTAIFLVQAGKNPQPGLWKIDASSWALSQVTSKGPGLGWALVDGSVVWGTRASATGYDGIDRLDTSTGVVQEVRAPGQTDWGIAGLAGSGVLVVSDDPFLSAEVVNVDGSSHPVDIPPALSSAGLLTDTLQDGPDILFATTVGLVAYDQNFGFQLLVSRSDLYEIRGRCVPA